MTKFESVFEDFQNAVSRLEEVLEEEKTDIVRDSAIQRFEIAFELAWKMVKAFLEEYHTTKCVSPQNCFREAFRVGLIDYDDQWLQLAITRNLTVHVYKEELAEKVYAQLPKALEKFRELVQRIKKSYETI